MGQPLIIYHGNCADGFGAAWVAHRYFKLRGVEPELHAGVYGEPPPACEGRDVFILDFSYKRPVLEKMLQTAWRITILDHHKTAEEDLKDLVHPRLVIDFSMLSSGVMLAWNYFFPNEEPPQLLLHIEDRDLWRFKLPCTREIQAALFSHPYDLQTWTSLTQAPLRDLINEGIAIERKHFKDIDELLKVTTRKMKIGSHLVPVANLPYTLASDAGHVLATGQPFAACYYDAPDGRVFSLRSHEEGLDVSEIARQYGGGGHQHAAGFRVAYSLARTFEVTP